MKIEKTFKITLSAEDVETLEAANSILDDIASSISDYDTLYLDNNEWDGESIHQFSEMMWSLVINGTKTITVA